MAIKLSDKAKRVIGVVAPGLGAALGGPLGGYAGNILAELITGGDASKVESAILAQSPETIAKLRQAEIEFETKLAEMGIERERIAMADRASARDLAKADLRPHIALSALFLVGYFLTLGALLAGSLEIPRESEPLFNTIFGVITANVPVILAFWFGSSAGSIRKTTLLANAAET